MNRLKVLYRGWGIPCAGTQVYAPRYREEWLSKTVQAGVQRRATQNGPRFILGAARSRHFGVRAVCPNNLPLRYRVQLCTTHIDQPSQIPEPYDLASFSMGRTALT